MEKKNVLKDKSFDFALSIIKLYQSLVTNKEYIMSKQLLRCGTSIGAMVRESQNAESSADFIHKLSVAQKECDETLYWLELLNRSGYIESETFSFYHQNGTEILKIIRSVIITSKANRSGDKNS